MQNEKPPREKRRVMFRNVPPPAPLTDSTPDALMMLDDRDAERIAEHGAERHDSIHASGTDPAHLNSDASSHKFRYLSARQLANRADKGLQKAHYIGGLAVNKAAGFAAPAVDAAKRRLPSLATLAGLGGKRAPGDDADPPPPPGSPNQPSSQNNQNRPLRRQQDATSRVIYVNDESRNAHFPTNYVSTTKYSPWTAIPHFLIEQFSRFSNAYFLVVGIGYTIDKVTPIFTIGRYSTLWVLAIVVAISGIKETIEDYHRFREDRRLNQSKAAVIGNNDRNKWASVHVGDILKVSDREPLPADIVLVASSNEDGLAYIETKQLDGESNLKVKVVPQAISSAFKTEEQALLTQGRIECEAPNDRLYKFNGRIIIDKVPVTAQPLEYDDSSQPRSDTVTIDEPVSLGPENLLVRGSSVRNTEWILGIVVNTGRDTKLMQNVKPRPRKNSRLERETNRHYFSSLFLQVVVITALTIRFGNKCEDMLKATYLLMNEEDCYASEVFLKFFTFFIVFSPLIPQSLYVSMEIVRAFQVYFIEKDEAIVDHETGVRTEVRTSNLNEELGVIHHVFTDKTGTLTANRMDFKKCSVAGKVYDISENPQSGTISLVDVKRALQAGPSSSAVSAFDLAELDDLDMVFRLLAICHSVVAEAPDSDDAASENSDASSRSSGVRRRPRFLRRRHRRNSENATDSDVSEREDSVSSKGLEPSSLTSSAPLPSSGSAGNRMSSSLNGSNPDITPINYQASSPDEAALVQAARAQGYTFLSRSNKDIVIDVFGQQEIHEILETLEFDSTRKRMSVITRDPQGRIFIFTKGADAMVFARLAPDQSPHATEQHLHDFAVEGLRTLCLAYAVLDEEWFEDWHRRYRAASSEIHNREEFMARIADEVERDLVLLGATAIEDKLQDGVPETLRKLEKAGVKIWVLTGDKQETAINIGLSCGAIDEGMDVVIINEDNLEDTAAQIDRALGRWSAMQSMSDTSTRGKFGLVIDGQTLHYALENTLQKKLMFLSRMSRSVIACRVSPKQKTEIVELVRRHDPEKVTLAIGDGANDVGMIQAAHVGVGIVGLEGQEAKLASDFSISQFRFLARLMLVHGRWNYKRLAKMVLYTIYKNTALTLCELYWAHFTGFTGQPMFDPWMGGLYNIFLTALPPVVLGIFDQELTADYALAFPEIYSKGQRNTAYNFRVFLSWLLAALWQSAIMFFVVYWGFGDHPDASGETLGMWAFGTVVFSVVVITVHVKLLVLQSTWNRLTASLFAISFLSWFIIGPIFSSKALALDANLSPPMYAVIFRVFAEPRFWLVLFLCPVICASPTLLWKYNKRRSRPNVKMLVQQLLRSGQTREDITGEYQMPLRRVPSYDPKRPATSTAEPVTFVVKGEREYQFSGFNFDAGESGSVLRHTFHTSRTVRRRRMRILKRSGSDTELHVEGVKSTTPRATNGSSSKSISRGNTAAIVDDYAHRLDLEDRRPDRDRNGDGQGEINPSYPINTQAGSATSHRRTVSDGAVLLEDRFNRLGQDPDAGDGLGFDVPSDDMENI